MPVFPDDPTPAFPDSLPTPRTPDPRAMDDIRALCGLTYPVQ